MFDSDLDGVPDEFHPEWANTVDWLGLQYYFRAGVTGDRGLLDGVTPCTAGLDLGACLPAPDPSYCVPQMGYEAWADGFEGVLEAYAQRYPTLPLVVTESGIASDSGTRHAESVVRSLETIEHARQHGVDVRGFYEWSLTDNFEWAHGFAPHFGLYSVDYDDVRANRDRGRDRARRDRAEPNADASAARDVRRYWADDRGSAGRQQRVLPDRQSVTLR